MRVSVFRVLITLTAVTLWLAGCSATKNAATQPEASVSASEAPDLEAADAVAPERQTTGSTPLMVVGPAPGPPAPPPYPERQTSRILGSDPNDELSLGKKYFRAGSFGLAEQHFRKAVEGAPRDAEAWACLAAAYDRLKRFDLADRAYQQAMAIVGPTPEILNNHGYSYMLRADYRRAREKYLAAQAKDPRNPYIQNNLELLDEAVRMGKSAQ
jgi:tetratricopeptide (TPR) repeat protein